MVILLQVVVTLLLPIAQIIAKYIRKILLTVTPDPWKATYAAPGALIRVIHC